MKFLIMLTAVLAFPCDMETCDWEGHCLGEPCEFYDENGSGCANDYLCVQSTITCVENDFVQEGCSWLNHCFADQCVVDDDCDSDLVCISEEPVVILQVPTEEPCKTTEEPTLVVLQIPTEEPTLVVLQIPTEEPCKTTEEPVVILQIPTEEPCKTTEEPVVILQVPSTEEPVCSALIV